MLQVVLLSNQNKQKIKDVACTPGRCERKSVWRQREKL